MAEKLLLGTMKGNVTSELEIPEDARNFLAYLREKFSLVKISFEYDAKTERTRIMCENISEFGLRVLLSEYNDAKKEKINKIIDYLIKESKHYESAMLSDVMNYRMSNNEMDSTEETVSTIIDSLSIKAQETLKNLLESYLQSNDVKPMESVFIGSIVRTLNERVEAKAPIVTK